MPSLRILVPAEDQPAYPSDVAQGQSLAKSAKTALAALLAQSAVAPPPVEVVSGLATVTFTIWINDEQAGQLKAIAERHHILSGIGDTASAVLHAGARAALAGMRAGRLAETPQTPQSVLDRISLACKQSTRPDQGRFYDQVERFVLENAADHRVLFAEASTGTGKTRAFLAAALAHIERYPGIPVVVAVPTYMVLNQTYVELKRMTDAYKKVPFVCLAGMSEFVSCATLEELLSSLPPDETTEAARAWIKAGGPRPSWSPFEAHRWLLKGLQEHAPGLLIAEEARLNPHDPEDDPGMQSYLDQFRRSQDQAQITICTHAMLAVDIRQQRTAAFQSARDDAGTSSVANAVQAWREADKHTRGPLQAAINSVLEESVEAPAWRLPANPILFVDEAHLIEQSFSMVYSSAVSLWRVSADLRELRSMQGARIPAAAVESVETAWRQLRSMGEALRIESTQVSDPGVSEALRNLESGLASIRAVKAAALRATPEWRRLEHSLRCVNQALQTGEQVRGIYGQIEWSPTRAYPRLSIGKADVRQELDFLWHVYAVRGVAVSATLYDRLPQPSVDAAAMAIGVRQPLATMMEPVTPPWVTAPVTLLLPAKRVLADGSLAFRRPASGQGASADEIQTRRLRWIGEVAEHIASHYLVAAGGMLVLGTAYRDIESLAQALRAPARRIDQAVVLEQRPGVALEVLRAKFLAMAHQGQRPLLLAVGGAWTGLDLSDGSIPAASDNVLTDLVILNAPIGTNRTISQVARRRAIGPLADIRQVVVTFRQGIGRLVRRENVTANRKIHFLDGRMYDPKSAKWMMFLHRALVSYSRRTYV